MTASMKSYQAGKGLGVFENLEGDQQGQSTAVERTEQLKRDRQDLDQGITGHTVKISWYIISTPDPPAKHTRTL